MKSLADLRAQKPTGRPERSIHLCLAPELVAEAQTLTTELSNIPSFLVANDDEEPTGPPRKLGDPEAVAARDRAAAIRARLAEVLAEMAEHEGEMRLRANWTDGEWRRWVNEHPSREEGVAGFERDQRVTGGFCNADDLIDTLGAFVHQWNGEDLSPTDWADIFEPVVATADVAQMATLVAGLYEGRLDFPQWRNALSTNLKRLNDFSSPANSESPTSASTAGSPASDTSATTETATA